MDKNVDFEMCLYKSKGDHKQEFIKKLGEIIATLKYEEDGIVRLNALQYRRIEDALAEIEGVYKQATDESIEFLRKRKIKKGGE